MEFPSRLISKFSSAALSPERCAISLSPNQLLCESRSQKANEEISVSNYIQLKNGHGK